MIIEFERATLDDIETLIDVRNQSFYKDFVRYGECPGYNRSKEDMTWAILNRMVYKIVCDGRTVGNISVDDSQNETCRLCCLCVIPDYENRGIGQEALRFIEREFPNATTWTLETPSDKMRNHYFYKKAGYKIIKEYLDGAVKLVLFQKIMNAPKSEPSPKRSERAALPPHSHSARGSAQQ